MALRGQRNQRALLRRHQLGFVFQGFNLLSRTTAIENIELPLIYRPEPAAKRHSAARAALVQVGLEGWEHHSPAELSGGQQQRVAIARALVNEPAIILADEPTGNLDLHTGEEIIKLLSELSKENGVTVITATHDYKMLATSDRILWIKDGRRDRLERREDLKITVGAVH